MRKGIIIDVTPADRARLQSIVRDRNSPQKHVWRARIIVLTADGTGTTAITRAVGKGKTVVWRWQERFMHEGVEGLTRDKTRPSRIPPLPAETIDRVVALTNQVPPHEATHWSAPAMAKAVGISPSSVRRIWKGHGLQPHRMRSFQLSNDPNFADKLKEVVGLYVDPPAHAVVLSLDEKSQIQALDCTQPGLPMKKGRCATMTHDHKRHGTTTLFAALDILEGKVIGRCMQRHRHQEFIRFLNAVEREVPADKAIHVVLDNYATHKHPKVRGWLARHQRVTFHFTPTSCSWANAVEGWFAKLTRQRLKRGVFTSIVELQTAINRFIAEANHEPKPFVWTKSRRRHPRRCPAWETSVRGDPLPPAVQGKLVRVTRGAIFDVAVDVRRGSPAFDHHATAALTADNWYQLWIPPGFAHGYCTLEDDTEVQYKTTDFYSPARDRGVAWNDPALMITWPVSMETGIVSERDRALPRLCEQTELFKY